MRNIKCQVCGGSGKLENGLICDECDGSGELVETTIIISQKKINDFKLFINRLRHDTFEEYADTNRKDIEVEDFKRVISILDKSF